MKNERALPYDPVYYAWELPAPTNGTTTMAETEPYEILIVDDDAADVRLVKTAIASGVYPCSVTTAVDGEAAMETLRRSDAFGGRVPDLILLDLNMPRMNGRETLRAIKADPALSGLTVVMLTTSNIERDRRDCLALGADDFATKPVDLDEMFAVIHGIEATWLRASA